MSTALSYIEEEFKALKANLAAAHDEISTARKLHVAAHQEIVLLSRAVRGIAEAMPILLERVFQMSKYTDSIKTLSDSVTSGATTLQSTATTYIGLKDENDDALDAAVSSLTAANTAIVGVQKVLSDAIDAHNKAAATPVDTSSTASGAASSNNAATGATSTVSVVAPTSAGTSAIPIATSGAPVAIGSTVTGPGIATNTPTTAAPGTSADVLVLSQPTIAAHTGDETLTITPPKSAS